MMTINITVTGFEELERKVKDVRFLQRPVRTFLTNSAFQIQANVQKGTPVDTGNLRGHTAAEVDASALPLWAKVESHTQYAPFVEQNTRPHYPPVAALRGWAHRHGMNVYAVIRKIGKYGTTGKHMFQRGAQESLPHVQANVSRLARDIEGEWGKP